MHGKAEHKLLLDKKEQLNKQKLIYVITQSWFSIWTNPISSSFNMTVGLGLCPALRFATEKRRLKQSNSNCTATNKCGKTPNIYLKRLMILCNPTLSNPIFLYCPSYAGLRSGEGGGVSPAII